MTDALPVPDDEGNAEYAVYLQHVPGDLVPFSREVFSQKYRTSEQLRLLIGEATKDEPTHELMEFVSDMHEHPGNH